MSRMILRALEDRCDDLQAATIFYARKRDSRAIGTWWQLVEARGTRDMVRRMVEAFEKIESAA